MARTKASVLVVLAIVLVAALLPWTYYRYELFSVVRGIQRRVRDAPPVVPVTVEVQMRATTGTISVLQGTLIHGIRRDGSEFTAWRRELPDGTTRASRRLSLADGTVADLTEDTRTVTALKVPDAHTAKILERYDPRARCATRIGEYRVALKRIGTRTILGFAVVGYQTSNDGYRVITWMAPDLNCIELNRSEEPIAKSGDSTILSQEATTVTVAEPAEELFLIPAGFDNVSFSEHYLRDLAGTGIKVATSQQMQFVAADKLYSQYKLP